MDDMLFKTDLFGAIANGYKKTNEDFCRRATKDGITSGTTAVAIFLRDDAIIVSNVGDSEAILCRNGIATMLSYSHLPSKEDEKERIQKAGGTVVWYGSWRVNGLLAVSRAIGDISLKEVVIPDPAIKEEKRTEEDEFVVLASDGLWDVMKYQEVCDFIKEQLQTSTRKAISQLVLDEALKRKTNDNCTVMIIFLDNKAKG